MALQAIKGGLWIPAPVTSDIVAAPAFATGLLMDATAEKVAFIVRVPKTGTLDKAEFRVGAVSINAASQVRVSFQNSGGADGLPDGTQDQFRDIAGSAFSAGAWMVPGLMTADGTDGGAKRSVTRTELLAIVLEYSTFTAADSVIVSSWDTGTGPIVNALFDDTYSLLFTASWVKAAASGPVVALKYNDGTYEFTAAIPCSALSTITTFNTGSTPDERALVFQLPVPYKVGGAWVRGDFDGDADLVLYDGAGSALATTSMDKDQRRIASGANRFVPLPSDVTLSANTDYYLAIKPTSATNVTIYEHDVATAAIMDAFAGGQNFRHASRTDAGAWTITATKRPWMGLLVTALDDGVGGGLLVHPGLRGRMNG